MTQTIWKFTIPVDDAPHTVRIPGAGNIVAAMPTIKMAHDPISGEPIGYRDQPDEVDIWVQIWDVNDPIFTEKRVLIVGTGHNIPDYEPKQPDENGYERSWGWMATVRPLGHRVVWHVLEAYDESLTAAWDEKRRQDFEARQQEFWASKQADAIQAQLTDTAQAEEVVTLPGGEEAKLADVLATDEAAGEAAGTLELTIDPNRPGPRMDKTGNIVEADKDFDTKWREAGDER